MEKVLSKVTLAEKTVYVLSALLLVIVPFHAVFMPEAVIFILQIISVLSLFVIIWSGLYRKKTYLVVFLFLFLSVICSILYVVPLDFLNTIELPGRQLYGEVGQWLASKGLVVEHHYLSLIPYESVLSLLALLPALALFFCAISLSELMVKKLIYLLLIIAGVQASLGLIQYSSANPLFYMGFDPVGRSAQGTYINRDHFAAFLEMILPMAMGLMLYSFGRSELTSNRNRGSFHLNQVMLLAFVSILIFLAAVFTRSRAGVFLIMIAILMSSIIFSRHLGGRQSVGFGAAFSTVAIGLAASIGLIPVLNRFVAKNPVEDERFRIYKHALEGVEAFFPFGSGPGTFPDVFRAFQPVEQLRFINNAHNDYIELLFDMGAVGAFIIIGFWLLYVFGWFKCAKPQLGWDRFHFIQVAAGLGILMLLLHSFVDFILHEPMNTMIFAFLVGVFFRKRTVK